MDGRRPLDVEQSLGAAPPRSVRSQIAARHAPQPDQGQRTHRLNHAEIAMRLQELTLRTIRLPLITPYVLSYRTFDEFEPIIVEARDDDGRVGWGEGHISPGSSNETREGGWAFCNALAARIIGMDTAHAKATAAARMEESKVAATALLTAIEMLESHPLLDIAEETRLPLLTPFNSSDPKDIEAEVEQRLDDGFRTFKIKVG